MTVGSSKSKQAVEMKCANLHRLASGHTAKKMKTKNIQQRKRTKDTREKERERENNKTSRMENTKKMKKKRVLNDAKRICRVQTAIKIHA